MPNTIVTSYNRNFPRRNDGQPTTMNFIGSPEIVTAFALAGRLSFNPLTDTLTGADGTPLRLEAPKPAPEVPAHGFDAGLATYIAPPEDGSGIKLVVDPNSERLQLMEPWPAWDGKDLLDMPVLIKTQGKTTTDHISPAGPWLRYRGHLDKFSDNMFMGATNAFNGEAGTGIDVLTSERGQSIGKIARNYKAHGVRWVAIEQLGASAAAGAMVACILVGVVVTPVARRWHLPFAAIGFASVVSMMPGTYIIRAAGGLVAIANGSHTSLGLISGTFSDAATALLVVLAMGAGVIVPKLLVDRFGKSSQARAEIAALYA